MSSNPTYSGYRGAEGGILGAAVRLKERKMKKIEAEAESKARPRRRPGTNDDGTSDGTLGQKEVAKRLAEYNDGVEPSSSEVMELLLQCPTNGYGRVEEADFDKVVNAWLSRQQEQRPGAKPDKQLQLTGGKGGCCTIS